MNKLPKEILRRITLIDIVEDHKLCKDLIRDLETDKTTKFFYHTNNFLRAAQRTTLRGIGDLWLILGTYASVQDSENLPKYALTGTLFFATTYLLDHGIYEVLLPLRKKK